MATAQTSSEPVLDSCQTFAQQFYDRYVPLTQKQLKTPAWNLALRRKPAVFSTQLFQALSADSAAQSKARGTIVGIDFDPFLGTQDPADRYQTRTPQWESGRCSVEVWPDSRTDAAEKSDKPTVVVELSRESQSWRFLNFLYPPVKTDLLKVLQQLKQLRSQPQ